MEVRDHHKARRTVAVVAIVCVLCQLALSPQISVLGGSVNFMMILAGCVALLRGGGTGVAVGFAAGALYDLTAPVPVGLMMLVLTVSSFALGLGERNRIGESFSGSVKLFAGMAVAADLVYGIGLLLMGAEHNVLIALLGHGLASAVLTTLVASLFILVLSSAEGGRGFSAKGGKGAHLGRIR